MEQFVRTEQIVSITSSVCFGVGAIIFRKLDPWTCSKLSSSLQLAILPGTSDDLAENWRCILTL